METAAVVGGGVGAVPGQRSEVEPVALNAMLIQRGCDRVSMLASQIVKVAAAETATARFEQKYVSVLPQLLRAIPSAILPQVVMAVSAAGAAPVQDAPASALSYLPRALQLPAALPAVDLEQQARFAFASGAATSATDVSVLLDNDLDGDGSGAALVIADHLEAERGQLEPPAAVDSADRRLQGSAPQPAAATAPSAAVGTAGIKSLNSAAPAVAGGLLTKSINRDNLAVAPAVSTGGRFLKSKVIPSAPVGASAAPSELGVLTAGPGKRATTAAPPAAAAQAPATGQAIAGNLRPLQGRAEKPTAAVVAVVAPSSTPSSTYGGLSVNSGIGGGNAARSSSAKKRRASGVGTGVLLGSVMADDERSDGSSSSTCNNENKRTRMTAGNGYGSVTSCAAVMSAAGVASAAGSTYSLSAVASAASSTLAVLDIGSRANVMVSSSPAPTPTLAKPLNITIKKPHPPPPKGYRPDPVRMHYKKDGTAKQNEMVNGSSNGNAGAASAADGLDGWQGSRRRAGTISNMINFLDDNTSFHTARDGGTDGNASGDQDGDRSPSHQHQQPPRVRFSYGSAGIAAAVGSRVFTADTRAPLRAAVSADMK